MAGQTRPKDAELYFITPEDDATVTGYLFARANFIERIVRGLHAADAKDLSSPSRAPMLEILRTRVSQSRPPGKRRDSPCSSGASAAARQTKRAIERLARYPR